jgi:hypothetical protein
MADNNLNVLSFVLKVCENPMEEGGPFITGAPVIDGDVLESNLVFDLYWVVAAGATVDNEIFFFTCGCGVPGCAGIHDASRIGVTEDTVTWVIAGETMARIKGKEMAECRFEFNRAQYVEAIAGARAFIVSESMRSSQFIPGEVGFHGEFEEPDFRDPNVILDEREAHTAQALTVQAWVYRVMPPETPGLLLTFPESNGAGVIAVSSILNAVADNCYYDFDDGQRAWAERFITELLAGSPENGLVQAKKIPWKHAKFLMRPQSDRTWLALDEWPECTPAWVVESEARS